VLDRVGLNAEYIPATSAGSSGAGRVEALPPRTIDLMKGPTAPFGAIRSRARTRPTRSWRPSCRARGTATQPSPHGLLDLYICLRPCKAYPGNPLNYKDGIDLVVFRENTEGMYIGVEFPHVRRVLCRPRAWTEVPRHAAISLAAITPKARALVRAAFEFARQEKRQESDGGHKPTLPRPTAVS